jgi:transposase
LGDTSPSSDVANSKVGVDIIDINTVQVQGSIKWCKPTQKILDAAAKPINAGDGETTLVRSDGMFPLITNDRKLAPGDVLQAYKGQPMIEKRFEQLKTVLEAAPVLLKDEGRIEALFTLYYLALLVQALIERELRLAMKRNDIEQLPLYPEQRQCIHPSTEQVLRLFSLAQHHTLFDGDMPVQVFDTDLTDLQRQVLKLLGVDQHAYRSPSCN